MKIKDIQKLHAQEDEQVFADIMSGNLSKPTALKVIKDSYELLKDSIVYIKTGPKYYYFLDILENEFNKLLKDSASNFTVKQSGSVLAVFNKETNIGIECLGQVENFFIIRVHGQELDNKKWNVNIRISNKTGLTIL